VRERRVRLRHALTRRALRAACVQLRLRCCALLRCSPFLPRRRAPPEHPRRLSTPAAARCVAAAAAPPAACSIANDAENDTANA
jgi:hypothetical protein